MFSDKTSFSSFNGELGVSPTVRLSWGCSTINKADFSESPEDSKTAFT